MYTDTAGAYQGKLTVSLPQPPAPEGKQQTVWQDVEDLLFSSDGDLYALLARRLVATRADGSYGAADLSVPLEQSLTLCLVTDGQLQSQTELQLPQLSGGLSAEAGHCFFAQDGSLWVSLFDEAQQKNRLAHFGTDGSLLTEIPLAGFLLGMSYVAPIAPFFMCLRRTQWPITGWRN